MKITSKKQTRQQKKAANIRAFCVNLAPSDIETVNKVAREIACKLIATLSQARFAYEMGYASRPEQNKRFARIRYNLVNWNRRYLPNGRSLTNIYSLAPDLCDPWVAAELLDIFPDLPSALLKLSETNSYLKKQIHDNEQYTHSLYYRELYSINGEYRFVEKEAFISWQSPKPMLC